ncbi:MAG: bifunctional nicotinamidase/pyrazinamidase [Alphaproteobacteria bacterium]|nr:bifunctional nicotinamidase/pyrazinamidase [Alphaproteobacteria bacterium]
MVKGVLLVVDVQNDFCPGGRLAVAGGDEIVPLVNKIARKYPHVVLTQDWHPVGHSSFATQHRGHDPFTQITMPYGPQTLWPDHCIIDSEGATFHKDLDIPHAELIIRKGFRKAIDSYSAFFENDHKTPTGLGGYLKERGFTKVTCVGLAFDYCVRFSAEDARKLGFEVDVIEAATRAIDLEGSVGDTRMSFRERGIVLK